MVDAIGPAASNSCCLGFPSIMVNALELKTKISPLPCKLFLLGYFITAKGTETKLATFGKEWTLKAKLYLSSPVELLPFFHCGEVIHCCILNDGQKHKEGADPHVHVHSLDVGHLRHGGTHSSDDCGHGKHCGDPCSSRKVSHKLSDTAIQLLDH